MTDDEETLSEPPEKAGRRRAAWLARVQIDKVIIGVVALVIAFSGAGLMDPLRGWDTIADWVAARAAWAGEHPYLPVAVLGDRLGIAVGEFRAVEPAAHPRFPGALLLQSLYLAVSPKWAVILVRASSLLIVSVLLIRVGERLSQSRLRRAVLGITVLMSVPVLTGAHYAAQSAFIALLLFSVLQYAKSSRGATAAGISLGVAVTLKAFPALLLIPLAMNRKWRALSISLLTIALLHITGSLLFDVSLRELAAGLQNTTELWMSNDGNTSLAGALSSYGVSESVAGSMVVIMAIFATSAFSARYRLLESALLAAAIGTVATPLAWPHYQVLVLAILPFLIELDPRNGSRITISWVLYWGLFTAGSLLLYGSESVVGGELLFLGSLIVPVGVWWICRRNGGSHMTSHGSDALSSASDECRHGVDSTKKRVGASASRWRSKGGRLLGSYRANMDQGDATHE